jgi:ATP adenylyltransferase
MKRIFAPWRMKYIESHADEGCIFCAVQKQTDSPETLVIHRGERAFVIVNRFPYTSGHLMVVANVHQPSLEDLDPATRLEMMELMTHCIRLLRQVYHPQGFNLGANIGEAAGAGIAGHVHLHVVPRWGGDANYMSTVAETRVLPETLEETYLRVRTAWEADKRGYPSGTMSADFRAEPVTSIPTKKVRRLP